MYSLSGGNKKTLIHYKMLYLILKRTFDHTFAFVGGIILSLFFIIISFLIKIDSKGPILFRQERVGKNRKLFKIYKFRTMFTYESKLEPMVSKENSPRITKVGRFLRKYKIDELPQLINVLKGEMSLVGPRPELPSYVNKFKEQYNEILKIKPGITDYASLKYINESKLLNDVHHSEEKYNNEILPLKLYYNLKYIEEQSFIVDIKLIFKTLWAITIIK